MQNSELLRRSVVLPLDEEAEDALRSNNFNPDSKIQQLRIPNQDFFERLWKSDLFSEINRRCDSLVDDYEEDFVELSRIPDLILAVETIAKGAREEDLKAFLKEFQLIAAAAMAVRRPLLILL
jgi:hypothetical protein